MCNRFNYQLLTMMVMDKYGEGQTVQHSLLESNSDFHMTRVAQMRHSAAFATFWHFVALPKARKWHHTKALCGVLGMPHEVGYTYPP